MPEQFVELLTQHQTRLQSYIASLLSNPESTWDVLQETNRVLIEKQNDFVDGTSFANWSLTVAQFQVMAWLRNQKRDRHVLTEEMIDVFIQDDCVAGWRNRDQRLAALSACLEHVSEPNLAMIRARYHRDNSLAEISAETSKSVNALKQLFFRLRKSLSDCIEERLLTS